MGYREDISVSQWERIKDQCILLDPWRNRKKSIPENDIQFREDLYTTEQDQPLTGSDTKWKSIALIYKAQTSSLPLEKAE